MTVRKKSRRSEKSAARSWFMAGQLAALHAALANGKGGINVVIATRAFEAAWRDSEEG